MTHSHTPADQELPPVALAASVAAPTNEPTEAAEPAHGLLRQVVESFAVLAIAVVLFRAFALEGYIISTGSMAPCLLGYHKRIECPDCGYRFAFGVAFDREVTTNPLVKCPNCSQSEIEVSHVPRNEGDQLLVCKHAFAMRDPHRWEIVVFLNPANPAQAYVKRVVGLPGEQIQVVDGDVAINGVLQRKSFEQQRAMRIAVFDQHFAAESPDWMPRWIGTGGWGKLDDVFVRSADDADRYGWVQYLNWPRQLNAPPTKRVHPTDFGPNPITDNYGYNRIFGMDEERPVRDLMLSARVTFPATGRFCTVLQFNQQFAVCEFDLEDGHARLWLVDDDRQLATVLTDDVEPIAIGALPSGCLNSEVEVEVSNFDQRLIVALNGTPLLSHDVDGQWEVGSRPSQARRVGFQPVEIPSENGRLEDYPTKTLQAQTEIEIAGAAESERDDARPVRSGESGLTSSSRPSRATTTSSSPVRFGAVGGAFRIQELRLYRDVHYVSEAGQHAIDSPHQLGDDEFFFLGDNSPVSLDSRGWKSPAVPRRLIVGKPLMVHLPSKPTRIRIGEDVSYIRLPDLDRMRWIR